MDLCPIPMWMSLIQVYLERTYDAETTPAYGYTFVTRCTRDKFWHILSIERLTSGSSTV